MTSWLKNALYQSDLGPADSWKGSSIKSVSSINNSASCSIYTITHFLKFPSSTALERRSEEREMKGLVFLWDRSKLKTLMGDTGRLGLTENMMRKIKCFDKHVVLQRALSK